MQVASHGKAFWPAGRGEMAERIRSYDWAATPLGPIETWPQSLKTAVDLMLEHGFPATIQWGPQAVLLYNDPYIPVISDRHPQALGRSIFETFQEIRSYLEEISSRVRSGETIVLKDQHFAILSDGKFKEVWFTLSHQPLRDESGAVVGISVTGVETTARILAEQHSDEVEAELREGEERQAFLLKLSDALRPLADPTRIQETASRILGEHLGCDWTYYAEFDEAAGFGTVDHNHAKDDAASIAYGHALAPYESVLAIMRPGRTYVEGNVAQSTQLSADSRAATAALGIDSIVCAPILKDGVLRAGVVAAYRTPHAWTPIEIALIEDVADRTWAAVEHARAQVALRESEERYRTLFQSMDEGFCIIEVLFDKRQRPYDYRFIETNPAFERHTGLNEAVGKTMREMAPDHEQHWFDIYGKIARTGEPIRFENAARALGRWYEVCAFRVGEPEQRRVAVLFNDISERKRTDDALRESEERFRTLAESLEDVFYMTDLDRGTLLYLSPSYERVWGRPAAELEANLSAFTRSLHPDDHAIFLKGKETQGRGEPVVAEYRIVRPDGSIRWIFDRSFPVPGASGHRAAGIATDITDRKRAEEALRESESQAKLLLAELQHRVRNTLAVIRSIARRTAAASETAEDYAMHLEGRIDAFARVQAVVTRDPIAGVDLEMLVAEELHAHAAHEGEQVTSISGPPIRLRSKAAETFALAIHELATNAVKYGALSSEQGRITVKWRMEQAEGGPRLVFDWIETGMQLSGKQPKRRGFGTELIERTLTYDLAGEASLRFEPTGLRCTITLPVTDWVFVRNAAHHSAVMNSARVH